jgi:multiple antibiotic resistance protein
MDTQVFLTALASYFVTVDPVGVGLMFHGLVGERDARYRRDLAVRAVLISVSVVLLFGFLGDGLLHRLGITMGAFRIAGGLLLLYTAFGMVTKCNPLLGSSAGAGPEDIAVFPLSFPLISGPGCLTLTILLFSKSRHAPEQLVSLILAVALIYGLLYLCLELSPLLHRMVGRTTNEVFKRLLGVVLAALAVQFIGDGVRELLK